MSKQKLAFLIVLVCFFMLSFANRATCYPLVESPIEETEEDKEAPEERKLVFFGDFRIDTKDSSSRASLPETATA